MIIKDLVILEGTWCTVMDDDYIRDLFGTDVIPTPYGPPATREYVKSQLLELGNTFAEDRK